MTNNKVSLISILLNEEDSIAKMIEGLLAQTRQPDEIVFVDGGSHDQTVKIIQQYINNGAPIKLIVAPGTNSAQAENLAVTNASHELIAITDAGCRADPTWLENLLAKYDGRADIISGVYLPDSHNLFEEALADLSFPRISELTADKFLPSNRSIAFKKSVWRQLGGYQERLRRSDDTWFGLEARRQRFKFVLAPKAIVYWRPRKNLWELFKYTFMDERSSFLHNIYFSPPRWHVVKLIALFLPFFGSLFYPPLFPLWAGLFSLYLTAKTAKHYLICEQKKTLKLLLYPLIMITSDFAALFGVLSGTFGRRINKLMRQQVIKD